ncbi:little elongation complex subunit 2 isoform X2 [Phyllopteryx taeniolatus]|uniref:little elongation complex subunit 2 isoform X2 n=1 Tax=Phyllopteryx taeniolatus TaxID=161469 RepID=UPI002AD59871|nr:little elongation complex subunit 2 isoform X2 [Phyllopteryx taeniolatus]
MDLLWEDPPVPDAPFFTKDVYDQYSLAPSTRERWASLQSPPENGSTKPVCAAQSGQKSTTKEFKDSSSISKDDSCWDTMDTDTSFTDNLMDAPECSKNTTKAYVGKGKQVKKEADDVFPQPRLPFPCMSSLSIKEQRAYLGCLCSKKLRDPPQQLKARVDHEVMQFQRYLQDVANTCADDYSFISQGALQYAEDYFRVRLECIRTLPQLYQICEMTSLTGGTFNPGLSLTFEKQLVVMGSVDITGPVIVPADAQLATDYQSVSSENPPAKKAKDMHAAISSDDNVEKLCAHYEPHVCLKREALITLLDNHGPDFAERWELPVCIKVNHGKGVTQKKTVYIESPLMDNEITVREKNLIYHEESLKHSIKKNGKRNVFHLMTELPVDEQKPSLESSQRNVISLNNDDVDFGVDLTDLETFGEAPLTTPSKVRKTQNEQLSCLQSASSPLSTKAKQLSEPLGRSSQEEKLSSMRHYLETVQMTPMVGMEANEANTTKPGYESDKESDQDLAVTGDSEDERLIIDDATSPSQATTPTMQPTPGPTTCPPDPAVSLTSESVISTSPSPKNGTAQRQVSKKAKAPADQLGEILRMQTAMFSTANDAATKRPASSQETVSPTRCVEPPRLTLPLSLVKPCVTSYLERNRYQSGEASAAPSVVHTSSPQKKKILSQELQAGAEDEQDYTAPERGNLLYKLYSLQDVLIIVRSSVPVARARKVVANASQFLPVHVFPKLDYQLCHGVECLSSSEACHLWTETALHSSTVSFIAHINPHTSKVALLRRLPDSWRDDISCGFKPAKSLNILHHLLKKLTKMEEGQYLITHKPGEPFVTLLKATDGKASRTVYDLHQVHSGLPKTPASGLVPWIPVDPTVVLHFHKKHGRVPCTFPPQSASQQATVDRSAAGLPKPGGKKKKKKNNNRSANRNKYIQKLIQHSV